MSVGESVAVIAGGRSSEHEVSLASGRSVVEGLREAGRRAELVEVAKDGTWSLEGNSVKLEPGRGIPGFDVAFPVVHGPWGEDGTLQGLLESLRVPFVGSGVLASATCIDKIVAKQRLAQAGIDQVDFVAVDPLRWDRDREGVAAEVTGLGFPAWVKPARLGSSVGISRVADAGGLGEAVEAALRHDPRVIIEASSSGREVEVSVLERISPEGTVVTVTSPPGEITLPGAGENDWYDYGRKYEAGGMELVIPARLSTRQQDAVRETALKAFGVAGCEGYARVDCFVEDGRVLVNEINTAPGFTRTSVFGRLFEATGVAFPELLDGMVEVAVRRHAEREAHIF